MGWIGRERLQRKLPHTTGNVASNSGPSGQGLSSQGPSSQGATASYCSAAADSEVTFARPQGSHPAMRTCALAGAVWVLTTRSRSVERPLAICAETLRVADPVTVALRRTIKREEGIRQIKATVLHLCCVIVFFGVCVLTTSKSGIAADLEGVW